MGGEEQAKKTPGAAYTIVSAARRWLTDCGARPGSLVLYNHTCINAM